MSQHDYNIANGGGAAVRADINNALLAILSQNSGATAPTTTKPFMFWYDTTVGVLKMRNAADTAWVDAITGVSGGNGFGMVNRVINPRMEIDQRNAGASVSFATGANGYALDRWYIDNATDGAFTIQQVSDAPAGFLNSIKATVTSTDTSLGATQDAFIGQRIEGLNLTDLGFGTASASSVTLSFWVKSSLTGSFGGSLMNSAYNRSYPFSFTINVANTWEQKTINIAGDTSGTWLTTNGIGMRLSFAMAAGSSYSGTANAWGSSLVFQPPGSVNVLGTSGATFQIAGVDLRKGTFTSAPAWDWRPYGTEFMLCQRYYQTVVALITVSGGNGRVPIPSTQVPMRATPAVTSSYIYNSESGSTTIASPTYAGIAANGSAYTSQITAGSGVMSTINAPTWSSEL